MGAAGRMMMTFLLLRQNNQHQFRARIKRQPHPQREERRGEWWSRSDGGGSHPDVDSAPLHTYQTQRNTANETQRNRLNDTIYILKRTFTQH